MIDTETTTTTERTTEGTPRETSTTGMLMSHSPATFYFLTVDLVPGGICGSNVLIVSTGTTLETTQAPAPTRSTRTSTIVSTLPGGVHTTVTSVEVVTAEPEEPTGTEESGELQTNVAVPNYPGRAMEVLVGAVIGGALLI